MHSFGRLFYRCNITRYYEGGVSSVFLWDLEDGGFAGVVLLKKGENDAKGAR